MSTQRESAFVGLDVNLGGCIFSSITLLFFFIGPLSLAHPLVLHSLCLSVSVSLAYLGSPTFLPICLSLCVFLFVSADDCPGDLRVAWIEIDIPSKTSRNAGNLIDDTQVDLT